MNKETKLMVRINDQLKKDATEVFASFGLDISTAIRMFLVKTINCKTIPLDPDEDTLISAILMGDYTAEEISELRKNARGDYKQVRKRVPYIQK